MAFVAAADDAKALTAAEAESVPLGVPLLLAGDGLETELARLGVRQVKVFGQPPAESAASPNSAPDEGSSGAPDGAASASASATGPAPAATDVGSATGPGGGITGWAALLPRVEVLPPDREVNLPDGAAAPSDASVLIDQDGEQDYPATLAVAEAAGARVFEDPKADPRQSGATIDFLRAEPEHRVLGIGKAFGTSDTFGRRVQAALEVPELPGGGQLAFPSRRMVALYGHPAGPALGALGEQGIKESVQRAKKLAKRYQPHSKEPVVPAFEIIATIASSSAGKDGDYSAETDVDELRPWIDAAGKAGVYVVLDLQPGRSDFLSQAKLYADLLKEPHVGLALDPEWRLGKGERHMEQIGSVGAAEINKVSDWLAGADPEKLAAAEGADPAPVPVPDDLRPAEAGDRTPGTGHGAARRRPRQSRPEDGDLAGPPPRPAEEYPDGLEELLRRGHADVQPRAHLHRGAAGALVRFLPVTSAIRRRVR